MTISDHSQPPHQPNGQASRQRCLEYLLGELGGDEAAQFERQLSSSPQLSVELSDVAQLLVAVAEMPAVGTAAPPVGVPVTVATESRLQPQLCSGPPQRARWPMLVSILAVAACLALLIFNLPTAAPPIHSVAIDDVASLPEVAGEVWNHSEDLLIAQAWASGLVSDLEPDTALHLLELEEPLAAVISDDPADIDSVLSWLFVAVSADIASQSTGVANGS